MLFNLTVTMKRIQSADLFEFIWINFLRYEKCQWMRFWKYLQYSVAWKTIWVIQTHNYPNFISHFLTFYCWNSVTTKTELVALYIFANFTNLIIRLGYFRIHVLHSHWILLYQKLLASLDHLEQHVHVNGRLSIRIFSSIPTINE